MVLPASLVAWAPCPINKLAIMDHALNGLSGALMRSVQCHVELEGQLEKEYA